MKQIIVRKSSCGSLVEYVPKIDGNVVLPFHGVTCYGEKQISRAGEYLDAALRKVGQKLSEFTFVAHPQN